MAQHDAGLIQQPISGCLTARHVALQAIPPIKKTRFAQKCLIIVVFDLKFREGAKGRFCERVVLANVPSFQVFGRPGKSKIIAFSSDRVALQGKTF